MDDVREALGALLVDEPVFDVTGPALTSAARRRRTRRAVPVVAAFACAVSVVSAVVLVRGARDSSPAHGAVCPAPIFNAPRGFSAQPGRLPERPAAAGANALDRARAMARAVCRLAGPEAVIDRVEVAIGNSVPSDYEVVMTYRRGADRAQVHITASANPNVASDICDNVDFYVSCSRYSGAAPSSLGHDKYGNVWFASSHADGTHVTGRSVLIFNDTIGANFDLSHDVEPAGSTVHGVVLAGDEDLLAMALDPAIGTTRPVADDGVSDLGDCGNPATFAAVTVDPDSSRSERVARAECAHLPSEWANGYLEADGSLAYYVEGKWGEIGVSFSDATNFDNVCSEPGACTTSYINGLTVSSVTGSDMAPFTVAADGTTAIQLMPNSFAKGGSVTYDITELQQLAAWLLEAYEGR